MHTIEKALRMVTLPFQVEKVIRSLEWEKDLDGLPGIWARVGWSRTDKKFFLQVNPALLEKGPDWVRAVLCHEVLHLALGHLLRAEGKNLRIWNIVTDSQVNESIPEVLDGRVDTLIRYAPIASLLGLPGKIPLPPEILYELFLEKVEEGFSDLLEEISRGGKDFFESVPEEDRAQAIAETLIIYGTLKDSQEFSQILKSASPFGSRLGLIPTIPQVQPCPWLLKLLKKTKESLRLKRARTYRREGRIPGYPFRGWVEMEAPLEVIVGLDASGSMTPEELSLISGYCKWLAARGVKGKVYAFDTQITGEYPLSGVPQSIPGGGGTKYEPVFEVAMKKRVSLVVLMTDGYPYMWPEKPPFRVICVLTQNAPTPEWVERIYTKE